MELNALVQIWPFILVLIISGLLAGFAGGLFGIGGGIIMVPVLYGVFGLYEVSETVRLPLAIGTSLGVIIVTAARSLNAHRKSGEVDWALLRGWLPWIGLGAMGAGFVAEVLPKQVLVLIFAGGALYVGVSRLRRRGVKKEEPSSFEENQHEEGAQEQINTQRRNWVQRFGWVMGLATGFFSSLMGLGGGAAGVLIMGWTGRSMHRAVATASGFGLGVAVPGVIGFILAGWQNPALPPLSLGFVSMPAFLVLGTMTAITAPIGATTAHRLKVTTLSPLFGVYVVIVALAMIREAMI